MSTDTISFSSEKINFEIDTRSVRRLVYTSHRHVNDGATVAGLAAGGLLGALVGSRARSTDHYLEIEYVLPDGAPAALLLRLHKDNQREIIDRLHASTGIPK